MQLKKNIFVLLLLIALWISLCLIGTLTTNADAINIVGSLPSSYSNLKVSAANTNDMGSVNIEGSKITLTANASSTTSGCTTTWSATTTKVTLTNGNAGKVTITYTAVDLTDIENGDNLVLEIDGGSTAEFSVTSGNSENDSTKTGSFTITGFEVAHVAVSTTFAPGEGGSYTIVDADGKSYDVGKSYSNLSSMVYTVEAMPDTGMRFVRWVDGNDQALSTNNPYQFEANAITIKPEFAQIGAATYYIKGNESKLYYSLAKAITAAGDSGTIVVASDGFVPAGNYTIPSGVTLLIPYDAENTLCTTKPTLDGTTAFLSATANSRKTPTVFRKLTMGPGAHITVNGAISLSGKMCYAQGSNGMPTGATSVIAMESGSSITVNSGGNLYSWGYVIGAGEVTVESGGTVYENFQLRDWRGGTAVSDMLNNKQKVFPASQYYVQNIEVKMTLKAGATEKAYMALVASKCFADATIPFVGTGGMFQLQNGFLVKDYLESEDRLQVDVSGNLSMSSLVISAKTDIKNFDLNSANYVLPITNNLFVNIVSGTTTISQDMAFLPGSELVIGKEGTVELASGVSVFVYDLDVWSGKKYVYSDRDVSPLQSVGTMTGTTWVAPKARPTMGDAKIEVNGTLDASLGYLFTTSGGANICSTGAGKVITTGAYKTDDEGNNITITHQYIQSSSSYDDITITPAKLKNKDGTYENTQAGSYYYCLGHGQWFTEQHAPTSEIIKPTCQTQGKIIATCGDATNTIITSDPVPHAWIDPSQDTQDKNIYICKCKYGCGTDVVLNVAYRLDDYLWFNASTTKNFLVDANGGVTVSDNIQTALVNGVRYFVKAIPADEIPDDLTFTIYIDDGEATFTVRLEDYVTNDEDLKQALLNYGTAAKDYFEKTYGETGTGNPVSGGQGLISPDAEDMAFKSDETTSVGIATVGANIYFDEAMRLAVKYRLSGTDSNIVTTADGEEYTIVQIGLLVKELDSNWTMTEALTTSTDGCTAYLTYNTTNKTVTSGGVENRPNADFKGEAAENLKTFRLTGMITFDLKSKDYSKGFALRTYVVLQDKAGNYHCAYGKQYGYGLEAYINATYSPNATAGTADMSFNNLLEQAWALAQEAAK